MNENESLNTPSKRPRSLFSKTLNQQLLTSARRGDVVEVQRVVAAGASINAKEPRPDYFGYTALIYACRFGHTLVVRTLIEEARKQEIVLEVTHTTGFNKGWQAIHWAAAEGHLPCIKLLADYRPTVIHEKETYGGQTSLHIAYEHHQTPVIQFLIARGADTTVRDRWGKTPLQYGPYAVSDEVARKEL